MKEYYILMRTKSADGFRLNFKTKKLANDFIAGIKSFKMPFVEIQSEEAMIFIRPESIESMRLMEE